MIGNKSTLGLTGCKANAWKGGEIIGRRGHILIRDNDNGKVSNYTPAHIIIAEKVLKKKLPPKTVIHHYGKVTDNSKLIICENQAYHLFLHQRQRAYNVCGRANWRKCSICKKYDDPKNLYIFPSGTSARHKACHAKYESERKRYDNNG